MPALENAKHEALAQELAKDHPGSAAYRKIWGTKSLAAAEANCSRLLKHAKHGPPIRARVDELRLPAIDKAKRKIDLTQEAVLFELARLGFSDMRRLASWTKDGDVSFKASDEIDDDTAAAIQEISVGTDGKAKFKLASKSQALIKLGEFMGMSRDDLMTQLLARLAGVGGEETREALDPREAARRAAMLLRSGRALGAR